MGFFGPFFLVNVQRLFPGASDNPLWSPDGSEVSIEAECATPCVARIVDPDTGAVLRDIPEPDPALGFENFGCPAWSPDGARFACGTLNDDPSRDGIYTMRSSDGGGLTPLLLDPGADDEVGDYSPDGKRLVFFRADPSGQVGIFVVEVDGTGLTQITPEGMDIGEDRGSWSPTGDEILFTARSDPDHHSSLWVVNHDGSGLHQLPIPSCGGAFSDRRSHGCFAPRWSPDGAKIVFVRNSALGNVSNIYTVNADGTGLFQVTHDGFPYDGPDWGPHPLAT